MERNWGFYNYFLKNKEDKIFVVAFTGKHGSYAVYTIDFLHPGEATYQADRTILDFDISSYIPSTKINLTVTNLEEKLKAMQPTQTSELEFRQFLLQKSN